jgi:hypothetical protein
MAVESFWVNILNIKLEIFLGGGSVYAKESHQTFNRR